MLVIGEIAQPVAGFESVLMMVAKAVATFPTCTERLLGKTAATSVKGKSRLLNSTAPMSHRAVPSPLPSTFRAKPRWSVCKSAPELSGSRWDYPRRSLDCRRPEQGSGSGRHYFSEASGICASETPGTMSVGPGVKPVTPALPLAPNKLKLFALTMLRECFLFQARRPPDCRRSSYC